MGADHVIGLLDELAAREVDPCVGGGSLLLPWKRAGHRVVGVDIERQGFHVVTADPDMATRLKYPKIAKVTGGEDASPAARRASDHLPLVAGIDCSRPAAGVGQL